MNIDMPKANLHPPAVRKQSAAKLAIAIASSVTLLFAGTSSTLAATTQTFKVPTTNSQLPVKDILWQGSAVSEQPKLVVKLPDNYDPNKSYKVLWALHGDTGAEHTLTTDSDYSIDVSKLLTGNDTIVVAPNVGSLSLIHDQYNGGKYWPPVDEYFFKDLMPFVASKFKIRPGRENHAVIGISTGGHSAAYVAGRAPGYFGSVGVLSGPVATDDWWLKIVFFRDFGGFNAYENVFGPRQGAYQLGTDPTSTAENYANSRVLLRYGNGSMGKDAAPNPDAATIGWLIEMVFAGENRRFDSALKAVGGTPTTVVKDGTHAWPFFKHMVTDAVDWGLFKAQSGEPTNWRYKTVMPYGDAWSVHFEFAKRPTELVTFERTGKQLKISGGGEVTLSNAEAKWSTKVIAPTTITLPDAVRTKPTS